LGFTPFGLQDLIDLFAAAFAAQALKPVNIGKGSQFGPAFRATALCQLLLQNENFYVQSIARLSTMQDPLPNGQPNPDVDSYVNAFTTNPNGFRNPAQSSNAAPTVSIPVALPTDTTIPVGYVFGSVNGPTFVVAPGGSGYNSGAGGYIIPAGQTSAPVYCTCSIAGSLGNVLPNTITQVLAGPNNAPPNPTFSVNNTAAAQGGLDPEVGQPLKARFAQYISGGGEGTPNSILAAVGNAVAGLTYSYGDFVMGVCGSGHWTFTPSTPSWFTICADIAGAPGTITQGQLTTIYNALLYAVRGAGIYFAVAAPTPENVAMQGTVVVVPGYDPTQTLAAVNAAAAAFVNNLGLDPYGNPMVCSLMDAYATCKSVPGCLRVDGLLLNGGTADITADFGTILAAGTINFTL
jgi:hypothetical protein